MLPTLREICEEKFALLHTPTFWHRVVLGTRFLDTVNGSESLRSPVEVGSLSNHLQGFQTIPGGLLGISEPSIVSTNCSAFIISL